MPTLGWGFALGDEFGALLGFPADAAFLEDALQQLSAGFGGFAAAGAVGAPLGGEAAFDGGFEQGLAVLGEFFLGGFEFGDTCVEVGEEFFQFGDNAGLFGVWCHVKSCLADKLPAYC